MPSLLEGVAETTEIIAAPDHATEQGRASDDDQLVEIWLHGRSEHTRRAYRADVERFRDRAGKPLARVTLSDLQQFAVTLDELAPASRYRTLSAVKSLLAFGHRIGYLAFDVGRVLRLPAVRNRLAERILPEADLHRILSLESHPRNRCILTLLYASGIRVSELCGLCWRDVQPNGDGGQITIFGKGGVTRSVQVPASVWKLVAGLYREDAGQDEPVFRSLLMRWTGALPSIWCRLHLAMPTSTPPGAISTPGRKIVPAVSYRCEAQDPSRALVRRFF